MIDRVQPDQFNQLAFRYTFSVDAMTKVSNIIENAVTANRDVADFHVSFQYLSRMVKQLDRHEEIVPQVYPREVPRPIKPELLRD